MRNKLNKFVWCGITCLWRCCFFSYFLFLHFVCQHRLVCTQLYCAQEIAHKYAMDSVAKMPVRQMETNFGQNVWNCVFLLVFLEILPEHSRNGVFYDNSKRHKIFVYKMWIYAMDVDVSRSNMNICLHKNQSSIKWKFQLLTKVKE